MNPTASKLALLERCPAAGALSSVWTESTDAQRAGTARHRFLQRAAEIGVPEALAAIPDDAVWRGQCEALAAVTEEIPLGEYELAFAYDAVDDAARCLGPWLERAYLVAPTEISGTADLICAPTVERPRWLVIDFKGDEEVEPAAENLQLGFYALCVARVHGLDELDVAIGYLRHGGGIWWDRATLGAFELEAVAARVRAVTAGVAAARAALAANAPLDYATGHHCRRCPALVFCPAQNAALRAFIADPPTPENLARLSDEDAGRVFVALKVFTAMHKLANDAVDARAMLHGLPLPDGGRVIPCEVERRTLVVDKVLPLLREKFGAQADAAVTRSLKNEAVEALARQLAPGRGLKKTLDALWSELAAVGGVKVSTFVQLRTKPARPAVPQAIATSGETHSASLHDGAP